jgi:hypothetical protein
MDGQILSQRFDDVHALAVDVDFDALVERGVRLLRADRRHSERAMRLQLAERFDLPMEAVVCAAAAAGSEYYHRHVQPRLRRRGKR